MKTAKFNKDVNVVYVKWTGYFITALGLKGVHQHAARRALIITAGLSRAEAERRLRAAVANPREAGDYPES